MKKIALGLMVVTLIVALSLSVMAIEVQCGPREREHFAWKLIRWRTGEKWVPMGIGDPTANARAWSSGRMWGRCNKTSWVIPVTVHASVAQWIEFSISGTRYDWKVRKPGTYAANSLRASLKSNGDVKIDCEGFADLVGGNSETNPTIPIWYAAANVENPGEITDWIPAADLNRKDPVVEDSADLHEGLHWKLWNKIQVVECNSACEYENKATITLVLDNQKDWIDPETGYFKGPAE